MSYQDELREIAAKRAKNNQRTKMFVLLIFLIAVFVMIHYLGKESAAKEGDKVRLKSKTSQEEVMPSVNETE